MFGIMPSNPWWEGPIALGLFVLMIALPLTIWNRYSGSAGRGEGEPGAKAESGTGPGPACSALAFGLFLWLWPFLLPSVAKVREPGDASDLYGAVWYGALAAVGIGVALRGIRHGRPRWAGWLALAVNAACVLLSAALLASPFLSRR